MEKNNQNNDAEISNKKNEENNEKIPPVSLEEKNKDLEEKIIRLYAEMENQRRRYEKEKDEAFEYGGFSFAKEALNLLDNLQRSKQSLENDESLKKSGSLNTISGHLDIIYNDMLSIFSKNNINPIKSINEKMDPNLHQAMMEVEDDTKEQGTIVQEIQKGFTIKDRLLRTALVAVSKKSSEEVINADEESEKSEKKQ